MRHGSAPLAGTSRRRADGDRAGRGGRRPRIEAAPSDTPRRGRVGVHPPGFPGTGVHGFVTAPVAWQCARRPGILCAWYRRRSLLRRAPIGQAVPAGADGARLRGRRRRGDVVPRALPDAGSAGLRMDRTRRRRSDHRGRRPARCRGVLASPPPAAVASLPRANRSPGGGRRWHRAGSGTRVACLLVPPPLAATAQPPVTGGCCSDRGDRDRGRCHCHGFRRGRPYRRVSPGVRRSAGQRGRSLDAWSCRWCPARAALLRGRGPGIPDRRGNLSAGARRRDDDEQDHDDRNRKVCNPTVYHGDRVFADTGTYLFSP